MSFRDVIMEERREAREEGREEALNNAARFISSNFGCSYEDARRILEEFIDSEDNQNSAKS